MRFPKGRRITTLPRRARSTRGRFSLAQTAGNLCPGIVAWIAAIVIIQPVWGQVPTWPPNPVAPSQSAGPSSYANGGGNSWDPRFSSGNTAVGNSGRALGNASWVDGPSSAYANGSPVPERPETTAALVSAQIPVPERNTEKEAVTLSGNASADARLAADKDAAGSQESLLRLPRSDSEKGQGGKLNPSAWGPIATTLSALAVVLGIFLIFAWAMRRASGKGASGLPNELVEILGQIPLNGRQRLCVLRFGRKLVLACVSVDGAETLAELTDPEEVEELLAIWRRSSPASATHAFRKVFAQYAADETMRKQVG
ncbi:FliO/MopB family protein [Thermopirellula anaerolimosa]